jgi:hypothetical protein
VAKPIQELNGWLDEHTWPKVACPDCVVGGLGLDAQPAHVLDQASKAIVDLNRRNLGPPDELSGTFHGQLTCDNPLCRREVTIAGDWQLIYNDGDPALGEFGDIYRLRYANPPLRLMRLPDATPQTVRESVQTAGSVIWISPSSAAGRLRQGVEALLTARHVKRFVITKGKRRRLDLHRRIELFRSTEPEVADALLAIKWIGNDGAHEDSLDVPQVLIGAQIMEAVLVALYDTSAAELASTVKKINANKGLSKSSK